MFSGSGPQTFWVSRSLSPYFRSKDRVLLNHICVESFGAKVQPVLVGGGRNEREDIVSPFMWRSGSEFKDERSTQFRGHEG